MPSEPNRRGTRTRAPRSDATARGRRAERHPLDAQSPVADAAPHLPRPAAAGHAKPAADDPGTSGPAARGPHPCMTATRAAAGLTRLELALMRCHEAFAQWAMELHKQAVGEQMTFAEIALLNCIRFRGGATTLAEMMIFLHRYDIAAISYNLRKLDQRALVRRSKGRFRKEVAYSITPRGIEVTDRFARHRMTFLLNASEEAQRLSSAVAGAADVLDRLSGLYDRGVQALARSAAVWDGDDAAQ